MNDRAEQSRINGAKSRGPITPEGKERVSQNPIRHGFYSKRIVIPGESEEIYEKISEAYQELLQPQNAIEADLVTDIVNARWLIRRAEQLTMTAYWSAHDTLLGMSEDFNTLPPDRLQYACFRQAMEGKNYIEILATMKEKHERSYHRALNKLEKLRRKKSPLPEVSTNEVEKEYPDNHQRTQQVHKTEKEQTSKPDNPPTTGIIRTTHFLRNLFKFPEPRQKRKAES